MGFGPLGIPTRLGLLLGFVQAAVTVGFFTPPPGRLLQSRCPWAQAPAVLSDGQCDSGMLLFRGLPPTTSQRPGVNEKVDLKGGLRGTAAGGRRTCHSTVC